MAATDETPVEGVAAADQVSLAELYNEAPRGRGRPRKRLSVESVLMPIINPPRARKPTGPWSEKDLIWGISRRAGYSDTDDPKTHTGVTQHAFELGHDVRAICGYASPQRKSLVGLDPRPPLAVPGPDNPRCPKCLALIVPQAASEAPAPRIGLLAAVAEEAAPYEASAPLSQEAPGEDQPLQIGWDAPPPAPTVAPECRGQIEAKRISVVGGWETHDKGIATAREATCPLLQRPAPAQYLLLSPPILQSNICIHQPVLADPLAGFPALVQANYTVRSNSKFTCSAGTCTIQPGVYIGGIAANSSANLVMASGL